MLRKSSYVFRITLRFSYLHALIVSQRKIKVNRRKENEKENYGLTDEQVEREIGRLLESPLVKLAKKDELIRYRRRQYLYKLRGYEKKGEELSKAGITIEMLEALNKDCDIVE